MELKVLEAKILLTNRMDEIMLCCQGNSTMPKVINTSEFSVSIKTAANYGEQWLNENYPDVKYIIVNTRSCFERTER